MGAERAAQRNHRQMLGMWVHPCLCLPDCGWQTLYRRVAGADRHFWSIPISSRIHKTWLPRTISRWILSMSKDRNYTTSPDNLCWCLVNFTGTTLFLILFQFCAHCPHCAPLKWPWLTLLTFPSGVYIYWKDPPESSPAHLCPILYRLWSTFFDALPSAKSSKRSVLLLDFGQLPRITPTPCRITVVRSISWGSIHDLDERSVGIFSHPSLTIML